MSDVELPMALTPRTEPADASPTTSWDRVEALLSRLSERLNPILVKEARQALRSRQFTVTFFLMLIAGWIWSVFGLTWAGPFVEYSFVGPMMFVGYFLILAAPLLVGAPYSAFHSLSMERQDRTFELVSITSLKARQILSGKLGSVILQMTVFLSAIFPCLAFTYLLRGLDIVAIVLSVAYACFVSLGLAMIGLLLAALTPLRQRQIVTALLYSVVLIFGLVVTVAFILSVAIEGFAGVDSQEFVIVHLVLLTLYVNGFALAFLLARSHLLTVSQNRSTAIRVELIIAQLCFLAWVSYGLVQGVFELLYLFIFFTTLFWYVCGIFLTGESGVLSPRVRRDLPQSTLGRYFLTLFAPGPGTGFLFVIANLIAAGLMAYGLREVLPLFFSEALPANTTVARRVDPVVVAKTSLVATSYVVVYLGIGKLLYSLARRVIDVRVTARVVIHAILIFLGSGVPWVVQMTLTRWRGDNYSLWQITSPIWTVGELCINGLPFELDVLVLVVPLAAVVVLLLNLPSLARELQQVRVAKPQRVAEEDVELAAQAAGPPVPQSPWG